MGGSSYSTDVYTSRVATSKATGKDLFTHDDDIRSGVAANRVHEKLDPSKPNTLGKQVRESFDSDAHPESRAIAVFTDVTGSMSYLPRRIMDKLPKLMAGLVKRGVTDPHVLFGAIGDATCDKCPLQIGQFEAGNEMDEALSLFVLEGGGGGQDTESYELAMFYMARMTDLDCYTKRNEKGFMFIIGDELPYDSVKRNEVQKIIGVPIEKNIPTEQILEELREKFEVFWFMPRGASNFSNRSVTEPLKKMFGQNYIELQDPNDICEQIIGLIARYEGIDLDAIKSTLKDIGADAATIARTTDSLAKWTPPVTAKAAVASGKLSKSGSDDVTRL